MRDHSAKDPQTNHWVGHYFFKPLNLISQWRKTILNLQCNFCVYVSTIYPGTDILTKKSPEIIKSLHWLVTAVESELWSNAKRSCDLMNAPEWWMWCIEVRREAGEVMHPSCIVHTVELLQFFRWPKKMRSADYLNIWIKKPPNKHDFFFPLSW